MSTVAGYANSIYNLALDSGLLNGPQVFRVRSGSDKYVVASIEEPTALVLPLNVLWVHLENGVPVLWRRVSKSAGVGTTHTWTPEVEYDTILTTENTWAPEDVPASNSLLDGGQLTGPLFPVADAAYTGAEVAPVVWIRSLVNGVRNMLISMYQNMNNRVLFDDKRIRELMLANSDLQARIAAVEEAGPRSQFIHTQDFETTSWVIDHGFDAATIVTVIVTDENGDNIWPEKVERVGEVHVVSFLQPQSGYALALGVLP